jgi:hypothetical protein
VNKSMSDAELIEIERRASNARPGPWTSFIEGRDHTSGSNFIMVGAEDSHSTDIELIGATVEDQDFIAAARQDVPKLIAEIRALRRLLNM